jgi:multimeric flavodoxin WrbA
MKVIGIVGSPRKGGNTETLTAYTLKAIAEEGVDTQLISLAGMDIRPCNACMACRNDKVCPIKDDLLSVYEQMAAADGIILASPVYFGAATALIRALMERAGYIARWKNVFAGKVGGPLVVARRAGHNFTHAELALWFHINGFMMPGSTYWNIAFGREKGEVEGDKEGMETAWNFGKNMAFLVKKLKG